MKISEKKAERELEKRTSKAEKILKNPAETKELLSKAAKKLKRSRNASVLSSIPRMLDMIKSYLSGEYKGIPLGTILAIVAAVAYFVSPIDALPDFIPFLGFIDDAGVLAFCLTMFQYDIASFEEWREDRLRADSRKNDIVDAEVVEQEADSEEGE